MMRSDRFRTVCVLTLALFLALVANRVTHRAEAAEPTTRGGVVPTDANGKPLNLDFETGTLKDWTAVGDAFVGQPIQGDTISSRRPDMASGHVGKFWIGGYELHGDAPQGTLTSVPFTVTKPWASFLFAGGSEAATRAEIVEQK